MCIKRKVGKTDWKPTQEKLFDLGKNLMEEILPVSHNNLNQVA